MSDIIFKDSVKLVLEEKVILEIPDSTVLHFTGYQTGLIMNSNSEPTTDWGSNNFNTSDSAAFHVYGWMDSGVSE